MRSTIRAETIERADFIDSVEIADVLGFARPPDRTLVEEILVKARDLRGLALDDVAVLMRLQDPDLLGELFRTAREVKEEIYGSRLVLFAPLYISNYCGNECTYCAFRAGNRELVRRRLTLRQIEAETRVLVDQGHKRILLVAGESYPREGLSYVLDAIATIYGVRTDVGSIRRINVNIAPLDVDGFRRLKAAGIGTYQLFQETYHRPTYAAVHVAGAKRDYDWRATAMDRAIEAGIDDVGVGVLFGLYDWRYEIVALMQHIRHLEHRFGFGPHTISVPRIEPAVGSAIAEHPPHAVSDTDFKKIIAILRLAVPYTGIILSTRESAEVRHEAFSLGVSQISAGSRTDPGGYGQETTGGGQFQLGDTRPLDEVVADVLSLGFTPSFCTACYRRGRTGPDFMDLAKPGEIKYHCEPNALSTCVEYLLDYASPSTREAGERHIAAKLASMDARQQRVSGKLIARVRAGRRDVFV